MKNFTIRKLQPIGMLPKQKDIIKKIGTGTSRVNDNQDQQQNTITLDITQDMYEENRDDLREKVCEDVLKKGCVETFQDLFCILLEKDQNKSLGVTLNINDIDTLKNKLIICEQKLYSNNPINGLCDYSNLAESFLEKKELILANYFFSKTIVLLEEMLLEKSSLKEVKVLQLYTDTKLGLTKCFEENGNEEMAVKVLKELLVKVQIGVELKNKIVDRLIELESQQIDKLLNINELQASLEKTDELNLFVTEKKFGLQEFKVKLKKACILSKMKKSEDSVKIIERILEMISYLPLNKQISCKVDCLELMADCQEKNGDVEAAENSYRSLHECLKGDREHPLKAQICQKLGDLSWKKKNNIEAIKYLQENYEDLIRFDKCTQSEINLSKLSLALASTDEEFNHYAEYLNLSNNRLTDVLSFKRMKRII